MGSTVSPHSKDGRPAQGNPYFLASSVLPWPLSQAAPRSRSFDMALPDPCILVAHPYDTGRL
eukprot:2373544-Pyramimonas_sp.AAC.1